MFITGLLYQAEGNSENLIEFLENFTFLKINSIQKSWENGKEFNQLVFDVGIDIFFDSFRIDEEDEILYFFHKSELIATLGKKE